MLKLLKMEIGMQMTGQRSDASTVDRDGDGLWGGGGPRAASSVRAMYCTSTKRQQKI